MSAAFYILRHSITGIKTPLRYIKAALLTLYPGPVLTAAVLFSLLLLLLFDVVNERQDPIRLISAWPVWLRWPIYLAFLLLLLLLIPRESTTPFIYFQF